MSISFYLSILPSLSIYTFPLLYLSVPSIHLVIYLYFHILSISTPKTLLCVHVCLYGCVFVDVCICWCVYLLMCVFVDVCICWCVYLLMCVFVDVCMFTYLWPFLNKFQNLEAQLLQCPDWGGRQLDFQGQPESSRVENIASVLKIKFKSGLKWELGQD